MSDKQIKIQVVADSTQAKKDLDTLVSVAKQPLLVPIKTDTTESLKNIKDVQSEFKLLQNQFQNLKVSGDLKGLSEVQTRLEFLSNSIKTIPKLDIKAQIDSQNLDNGINKIRTDINSLVNTAKQPIQIPLKTDSTEAVKSLNDIKNEAKLLQTQFQSFKISGDTSAFSNIKSQVQDLSNKLKDIPKLDIKGQIQSQNIDNGLAKIKKDIADVQSGKIDIKAYLSGSFQGDIGSLKSALGSIQKNQTVQIAIAGLSGALSAIGAIKNALGSLYNMASQPIGNFLSEGYEYVKDIESSATSLGLALSNQATSQNKANQAFADGKGTLEDYATITGKTTESLYENVKASGGAGGATKSLKADTVGLKGELLELKKTTQEYNREAKYEETTKKELEKATKYLVQGYKSQIDQIQDVILGMENQEKAALIRTKSTDQEIKDLERLIKTKQLEIDIDEKKLNREKSKQEKDFDKTNKPALDEIAKKEIQLDKKSLEIQKRKNLLDNNPTQNASALAQIKNEEEGIREQNDALRLQKDEIRLKRTELVLNIETQQESQRNLIENRKEELEKNKEIADAKKTQNEQIKSQFETQIDDQKKLIDGLKDKIEKANIKLDLDTKPIQDKIDSIKQKITELQDQSQDIQTEISDRQQAVAEANSNGGGGGGGGGSNKVLKAGVQADLDKKNTEKPVAKPITKEEVQDKLNQILKSSTKYAADTPFEKKDVLNLAAQATSLGFDPLAGTKNGDISGAGYNNILNVASDFVAKRLQINGGSSKEAVKDFTRAIAQLKNSGKTQSFSEQFGTTSGELISAGQKVAPNLNIKKSEDLASLSAEQLTQILGKVAEVKGIQGSAKAQTGTLAGLESNSKDAYSTLFESFFGIKKEATLDGNFVDIFKAGGLGSEVKKTLEGFINTMNGTGGDELRKSLEGLGKGLGDLLKQLVNPENLKATFDGLKNVVDGMKAYLTPDNIKSFATAIGDFVKGIPGFTKAVIDFVAGTVKLFGGDKKPDGTSYEGKGVSTLKGAGAGVVVGGLGGAIVGGFNGFGAGAASGAGVGAGIGALFGGIGAAPGAAVGGTIGGIGSAIGGALAGSAGGAAVGGAIGGAGGFIFDEKTREEIGNFFTQSIPKYLDESGKSFTHWISEISKNTGNFFTQTLPSEFDKGKGFILGWSKDRIKDFQDTINSWETNIGNFFTQSIPTTFESGKNFISNWSQDRIKDFQNFSQSSAALVSKFITEDIPGFLATLPQKFNDTFSLATGFVETEKGKMLQFFIDLPDNIKNALAGVGQIFTDAFSGAATFVNGILDKINAAKKGLASGLKGEQPVSGKGAAGNLTGYSTGGAITGGSGLRDDVPIMAMGGEFVLTKNAVNKYGLNMLNELNQSKFNLNTPKIESLTIPTAPSPRISNAYNNQNNQKSQTQTITNHINVPDSGNFDHNLKNSLVLYSERLNRSLSSGFSNLAI